MNARRMIVAALSEDSLGGIATLADVERAEQLADAHQTEVRREDAALIENAACDADWSATPAYCQGLRAGAELLLAKTMEKATPAGATATPELTVYRASHDSIVMGLYTTAAAAREHCEAEERHSWPGRTGLTFAWIPDDSEPMSPEELSVFAGQNEESVTGYVVTPLEVASKYEPEDDE